MIMRDNIRWNSLFDVRAETEIILVPVAISKLFESTVRVSHF